MIKKITYCGEDFELETCRTTILKLIQGNAELFPDEKLHLHFRELDFPQFERLQSFFKQYIALVPSNVTLHLQQDDQIILITGRGIILKDYEEILEIVEGLGSKTDHPALQQFQFIDKDRSPRSSLSPSPLTESFSSFDSDDENSTSEDSESDEPTQRVTRVINERTKDIMEEKIPIIEHGIKQYKKERDCRPYVDFMLIPLFQYTRIQKKMSADNFLSACKGERMINSYDRKILKNGRLSKKLKEIFNSMGFLHEKSINTGLDEKFDQINQRNVLNCFIALLEQYQEKLRDNPPYSKYPFFNKLFFLKPAVTIEEEILAISNVLQFFSKMSVKPLSQHDFDVLSQGKLSKELTAFLKEYGKEFSKAIVSLGIDTKNNPIYSIEDLRSLVLFDRSESPTYLGK